MGISPNGRELLFLIDGFGINTFSQYADVMPTMSRMFNHGLIQTAFPSTTATSLATLTTVQCRARMECWDTQFSSTQWWQIIKCLEVG